LRTLYLGREEVDAYVSDFAERLEGLGDEFPTIWCPIGKSGDNFSRLIAERLTLAKRSMVQVVPVSYDKSTRTAKIDDPADQAVIAAAKNILLLDSSVHSGGSMLSVIRLLDSIGTARLLSYTLVIKRGAKFLPHYFGVVVGDHDRVLFLLDSIPNNRLFAGKDAPVGFFRRIESDDAKRVQNCLDTGVGSLDKISWGDLYYDHRVNGYDVIVVENRNLIAGFVKLKIRDGRTLCIDVIANDKAYRGKGVGGALMRYAETIGRAHECRFVELWAIQNQVQFYQNFKFDKTEESIDTGGGEVYTLMRRPLLYQFDLAMHTR
jgi:GNAT superfamily N-acetyltransferase/hypoxanthine-guanine phosphoribosyltransferase